MLFSILGCKNMSNDTQDNAIEFGRLKIGLSYITVLTLIVIAGSSFLKAMEWGQYIGKASDRLARLESTTDKRYAKLEERIEKLEEALAEQRGDQKAIKALLEQLIEDRKNAQKKKGGG